MIQHLNVRGEPEGLTLWPFRNNWSDSYDVALAFKTDIIRSRSGKEQRRALRNTPRKTVECSIVLTDAHLRAFDRLMLTHHDDWFVTMNPVEWAEIVVGMPSYGFTVEVDTVKPWMAPGAYAVLLDGDDASPRRIESVDGHLVTFEDGAEGAWTAGSRLFQGNKSWLDPNLSPVPQTNTVHRVGVAFNVEPGSEQFPISGQPRATFEGLELLTIRPNWGAAQSLQWTTGAETVDFEWGRQFHYPSQQKEFATRSCTFVGQDKEQSDWLVDLFRRHRGQLGSFWWPTWGQDFVPVTPIVEGVPSLLVAGDVSFLADTLVKGVAVLTAGGELIPNFIESFEADSGYTRIHFKYSWNKSVGIEEIRTISFMPKWRFGSDTATFQWLLTSIVQVQFAMRMIED